MIVVNAFLQSGRIDEASAYLAAINSTVGDTTNKIVTGNFVADAIFNHKAIAAAQDSITLSFEGTVPGNGIANEDLCTILANLLDNAIEACSALSSEQGRTIKARGFRQHDNFLLHVENPTALAAVPTRTTKRDRKNHGLGLKNVERVAKRYEGSVNCSVDNGVFSADIRLCLQQKIEE
jgi:sensor histidine kinase regulating citrate/malate metabolism